jgi:hypothetical protein
MSTPALVLAAGLVLGVVALVAYQSGRRHGRVSLPTSLVAELRGHKITCMGEAPDRVSLEIALLCDSDDRDPPVTSAAAG